MMLVAIAGHVHDMDSESACFWYMYNPSTCQNGADDGDQNEAAWMSLLHALFASFSTCYFEVPVPSSCLTLAAAMFRQITFPVWAASLEK